MTQVGTEFHLAWNGEEVYLGSTSADPTTAVVDLGLPVRTNDRGDGVTGRGQLIFADDVELVQGDPIWIRDERWEYDTERKAEDGNRMVFIIRREQNFTASRFGGYQGNR